MLQVESIEYDPLKSVLGRMVSQSTLGRRLFYTALGALFLRQWHVRAELKRIARSHRNIRAIFDAGSGYGQYSYLMTRLFPTAKITAVDVKDEQIAHCNAFFTKRGRANVRFEVGDLTKFEQPDSFDLALSVDVMEHILDDMAVYRHVYNSLRPGGLFIMNTPRTDRPDSHVEMDSVIGEHVREGYTEDEIVGKFKEIGFEIERLYRPYHPFWGRVAWTILQRVPMMLLSRSKALIVLVIPWMLVLYPLAALSMWIDTKQDGSKGWGWLITARKP